MRSSAFTVRALRMISLFAWCVVATMLGLILGERAEYPLTPAETSTVQETLATPWAGMVLLHSPAADGKSVSACSGFLISEQVVATAAHCLRGKSSTKLYPGAHRKDDAIVTPYGECRSSEYFLPDGSAETALGSDYAALRINGCDATALNPAGSPDIGRLTGFFTLKAFPDKVLSDLEVTAAGYPGNLSTGELQVSEGEVRALGCDRRLSLLCTRRWNITAAMTTPPGHSGGVLLRTGTTEAVGLLDAWSGDRNESLFLRIDDVVLADFTRWVSAPASPAH